VAILRKTWGIGCRAISNSFVQWWFTGVNLLLATCNLPYREMLVLIPVDCKQLH
jgi:hypothetical protein